MRKINPDNIVNRSVNLLSTELDDETILMSVDQGKYFGMDRTSREIWRRLEKPVKVAELIAALATTYDVSPAVCQCDVIEFLEDLLQEQLIVVV